MRLTSVLSYSLTSLLVTVAACGDTDSSDGAKFSAATEAQRQRAVVAASGTDAAIAFLVATIFTTPGEFSCPTIEKVGATTTATFNCDDDNGNRVDGVIEATNLAPIFGPGGDDFDPTRDQVVSFEGYRVHSTDPRSANAFDGMVTIHPDSSMTVGLDATVLGIGVFTDAVFQRAGDLTSAKAGSTIEIDGLGQADIAGAWNLTDEAPAGVLEIKGADTLRADVAAMADGCVPLTIDGQAAGELCMQSSDE